MEAKRTLKKVIIASLVLFAFATNINAQSFTLKSGPYIRVGAGYYADINLGAGYTFPFRLSVGAEATTWSMFCGFGGDVDLRYRFLDKQFSPFIDAKIGYGLLGKTREYQNYYDLFYSAMVGVSWRQLDLGVGVAYDCYYKACPVANLSYTFVFGKK